MNLHINIKITDTHGHEMKEFSTEIENFKERGELFSMVKAWVFEVILRLRDIK